MTYNQGRIYVPDITVTVVDATCLLLKGCMNKQKFIIRFMHVKL